MMEKTYTLSGSRTSNFMAEFTEKEMVQAGYDCPEDYAHDLNMWERADIREGDPCIEIYDIDIEGGE